jgi:hypothetical protein
MKSKSFKKKTDESESNNQQATMLTINEEVTIFEYAPKKF